MQQDPREREYERLVREIMSCTKCPLHRSRRNPVPGEGPLDARVMFVGEAPGRREDEEGRPFVGPAGKLLNQLLEQAGLSRDRVYITNIVKCRPPGNRDPRDEEIEACLPYLLRQIQLIKPRLIVALGRHAARTLFRLAGLTWRSMGSQHGKPYRARIAGVEAMLVATYHPAAALYRPPLREVLEQDFRGPIARLARQALGGQERTRGGQRSLLDYIPPAPGPSHPGGGGGDEGGDS